jgi:hypothetical protein
MFRYVELGNVCVGDSIVGSDGLADVVRSMEWLSPDVHDVPTTDWCEVTTDRYVMRARFSLHVRVVFARRLVTAGR